jgi:hypothetical protein
MPLQMILLLHAVGPIHQPHNFLLESGLTLQTGVLRSHNRTVASSPEEMNESSAGLICNDRTLFVSSLLHHVESFGLTYSHDP